MAFAQGLSKVDLLVEEIKSLNPIYWKQIHKTINENGESFYRLGERLVKYAETILGDRWLRELSNGYIFFVNEVNKAQSIYEREGKYQFSSFSEVSEVTYLSRDFMKNYHWGVYVTTFAWQHHLSLNDYFNRMFLAKLGTVKNGYLVDFGTGSGIWLSLALSELASWDGTGVDISPTSVAWANALVNASDISHRVKIHEADALNFSLERPADAAISCFLLEHLESPGLLLENIYRSIKPGAPAFVCGAITAAEIDHIFEFKRESELVRLAENNGFRVVSTYSSSPQSLAFGRKYLPRSMGMVIERRRGDWW